MKRSVLGTVFGVFAVGSIVACAGQDESTTSSESQAFTFHHADDPVVCTAGDEPTGVSDVDIGFRVLGVGEGAPSMSGGSEEGLWIIDTASLLLPSGVGWLVSTSRSHGTARGFVEFHGGKHRIQVKGSIDVQPIFGSAVHQETEMNESGSYVVTGSQIDFTPNCTSTAPYEQVQFTNSGTRGTIVVQVNTDYGTAYFVLEGNKS
jgi:hypothetical protein